MATLHAAAQAALHALNDTPMLSGTRDDLAPARDALRDALARSDAYAYANPFGGPAATFRAAAERIEAGEDYNSVLGDYGLRHEIVPLGDPVAWMFDRRYGSGLSFVRPEDYEDEDGVVVRPTPLYRASQLSSSGSAHVTDGRDRAAPAKREDMEKFADYLRTHPEESREFFRSAGVDEIVAAAYDAGPFQSLGHLDTTAPAFRVELDPKAVAMLHAFIAPAFEEDQDLDDDDRYPEIVLDVGETKDDDGPALYGLRVSLAEYPSEGALHLVDMPRLGPSPAAKYDAQRATSILPPGVYVHTDVLHHAFAYIRGALEAGDSVIDARAARILVDEVDRMDEEAKQAPVAELHDQQVIERFLERAGKYLTNDASREAAIRAAVEAEVTGTATTAARDVIAERKRQTDAEGYDTAHDDEHDIGELAAAAAAYAAHSASVSGCLQPGEANSIWPWARGFKPKTPREDLVRAGALILAEIERLDRDAKRAPGFGVEK